MIDAPVPAATTAAPAAPTFRNVLRGNWLSFVERSDIGHVLYESIAVARRFLSADDSEPISAAGQATRCARPTVVTLHASPDMTRQVKPSLCPGTTSVVD